MYGLGDFQGARYLVFFLAQKQYHKIIQGDTNMFPGRFVDVWRPILIVVLAIISGCESGPPDGATDDASSFSLPRAIVQSRLSETGTIRAYIQVDEGARQAMSISGSSASIQLSGLSSGSHKFTIILEYELSSDPGNVITLGSSTKFTKISSGNNTLAFDDPDFNFNAHDDDRDGISNLDEFLGLPNRISNLSAPGNATTPILEYNYDGDGIAIWEVSNIVHSLVYSIYSQDSDTWSPETILSSSTDSSSMNPQLVGNGYGYALVWRQYTNAGYQIYSSFYNDSDWSTPEIIDTEDTEPGPPVIASNNSGYAVAWHQDQAGQSRIFARISSNSSTWEPAVVIDNSATGSSNPKISSTEDDYAVIWLQDSPSRVGVNIYSGSWSSTTAELLDESSAYNVDSFDIASNGTGYSVIWGKHDGTRDNIYSRTYYYNYSLGFIWSSLGEIDGSDFNASFGNQSITSNGSGYAVAFRRYNGTTYDAVAGVNNAGNVNWDIPQVLENKSDSINGFPIITSNGDTYAALWSQYDGASTNDLYASVYSADSSPAWSTGLAIETVNAPVNSGFTLAGIVSGNNGSSSQYIASWTQQVSDVTNLYANVYNGSSWNVAIETLETRDQNASAPSIEMNPSGGVTVAWSQAGAGVFTRVFDGNSWGSEKTLTSSTFEGSSYAPTLFSNGNGKTLALWQLYSGSNYNLYANIHEEGVWGPAQVLSTGNVDSSTIHAASDGNGFAVTWGENDGSYDSIYASVFDGTSWGSSIEVDNSSLAGDAYQVSNLYGSSGIASNGNGYMLVFRQFDSSNYHNIYARAYDGSVWSSTPQALRLPSNNNAAGNPGIISNGSSYLAAWPHFEGIYLAYASEFNGSSWSSAALISQGSETVLIHSDRILLATDGTDYLAAWTRLDLQLLLKGLNGLNHVMVNTYSSGRWETAQTIDTGTASEEITLPTIVSNGNGYALAWNEHNGSRNRIVSNIYNGASWLGPEIIDDGSWGDVLFDSSSARSLTTNGDHYAIVWTRHDSVNSVDDAYVSIFDGTNSWSSAELLESSLKTVSNVQIASNGTGFLATWLQANESDIIDIVGNQYDTSSTWGGANILDSVTTNSAFELKLSGSLEGYLATWIQAEPEATTRIPWARVRF